MEKLLLLSAKKVYTYDYETKGIVDLPIREVADFSAVSWSHEPSVLLTGNAVGGVDLADVDREASLGCFILDHSDPIYSASWKNTHEFGVGSLGRLTCAETRCAEVTAKVPLGMEHPISALKWSASEGYLAASDGEGLVSVFDVRSWGREALFHYEHAAGVKALGWSPINRNLLVSADFSPNGHFQFFDLLQQKVVAAIPMGSPVHQLEWVDDEHLLYTHYEETSNLRVLRVKQTPNTEEEEPFSLKIVEGLAAGKLDGLVSSIVSMRQGDEVFVCAAEVKDNNLTFYKKEKSSPAGKALSSESSLETPLR